MKKTLVSSVLLILALNLVTPAQAIDICGNGICVPPLETITSCPVDCGGTAPPAGSCNTCSNGACSLPGAGVDQDEDTIPDRLENQLAHSFFPNLWLRDHPQDKDVFYGSHAVHAFNGTIPYRISFAPSNANLSDVCTESTTCLEVRFGLAYQEDFGDGALGINFGGHVGDSEFAAYIAWTDESWSVARNDPSVWQVAFSRLNHHTSNTITRHHSCRNVDPCNQYTSASQCQFASNALDACAWTPLGFGGRYLCRSMNSSIEEVCGGATPPLTVWGSEKKHASYATQSICNNSGWGVWPLNGGDDCSENDFNARPSVTIGYRLQNIGEGSSPIDSTISQPRNCGEYDILDNTDFADSSPYFGKFFNSLDW